MLNSKSSMKSFGRAGNTSRIVKKSTAKVQKYVEVKRGGSFLS